MLLAMCVAWYLYVRSYFISDLFGFFEPVLELVVNVCTHGFENASNVVDHLISLIYITPILL